MNYVGMRARALRFGVAAVSLAAIACPASAQQMSDADAATAFGKRESVLDASLSPDGRSEEHTSELQSLMRISYAVFCLQNIKISTQVNYTLILYNSYNNTTHYNHITVHV